MGDRPGSSSRVRTSEDKVRRKDLCWSVRAVYILEKLPDVSGPGLGEAGRHKRLGALPPVDLRAVCFVRAICTINMYTFVRQDHNG